MKMMIGEDDVFVQDDGLAQVLERKPVVSPTPQWQSSVDVG